MKRILFLVVFLSAALASAPAAAETPGGIAGLELGGEVNRFTDLLRMETALPIRYEEYLKEVETKDLPGFKSGLILYGDCGNEAGRIIRIKMKYSDPSKKFYQQLLNKYKKRFGEPEKWRGDSFGIVQAWKWVFETEEVGRITMILQHNTQDEDERIGNSVKMTATSLLEDETRCWLEKHPDEAEPGQETNPDWEALLPH